MNSPPFEILPLHSAKRSNFRYSFAFLSKAERNAINVFYDFCRHIDDVVDGPGNDNVGTIASKRLELATWRNHIRDIYSNGSAPAALTPLAMVVRRFGIPQQYLQTIIDGCERDLRCKRYETFADLKEYCYGVASVVGLASIEIFGYRHEQTRQYAIHLGYALQLTNIIRDVKTDKDRGYIYIPREDMERFHYSEQDLNAEIYDDRFRALMAFQTERARSYFHKARTMLKADERTTMVAAEIMDAIYYRLLDKIELRDYNVFSGRIKVSGLHKLITATRLWLGTKLFVKRMRME